MSFPAATPSYAASDNTMTLDEFNHLTRHTDMQTDLIGLSGKVGTGASTPTAGKVLRANGTGTSAWGAADLTTDVTGVLPIANGGTGSTTGLPITSANIDYSTFLLNVKYAVTTSSAAPSTTGNTDLGPTYGATVSFTVGSTCVAFVTINTFTVAAADHEHRPTVFLDGSATTTQAYTAQQTAGSRAVVRSFSKVVTLTAGTHTLSAGAFTSSTITALGGNITVIVLGNVTA